MRQNFINTTSQATTSNGTSTLANLFDKDKVSQWSSENAGTDATTATLRIIFGSTMTVSQVIMANHNLKNFKIRPNTTTSDFTPSISMTTNSATSNYWAVNTLTTVKEVVVSANTTITADNEKSIGELIISNLLYSFATDRLPAAENYTPRIDKKQIVHEMSDGGINLYNISSKFRADIDFDFVPTSTVESLRTIYNLNTPFVFIPFETATSWNGSWAECIWPGAFEFEEFTDNTLGNGYTGSIKLRQTAGGAYS
ncbi:MAG: hypothetical protein QME32_00320 [Endomicrobiia bacterium]|nr:hypothetical protein [Endomicrobiia bacterium]